MDPIIILLLFIAVAATIVIVLLITPRNQYTTHSTYEGFVKEKTPMKRKLNILVLQDGAYDEWPEYSKYSTVINEMYAKKWNYDYKFIQHSPEKIPPYWLKVHDIFNLLPQYDAVMYLDLDAVFYDFDSSIEQFVEYVDGYNDNKFDIYIGNDPVPLYGGTANAGAFIVRNTPFSANFLSTWFSSCFSKNNTLKNVCAAWTYDSGKNKWGCDGCGYTGIHYEQGVFNTLLQLYSNNIAVIHKSTMCNFNPDVPSFVLHLMGKDDDMRSLVFDSYLKLLNRAQQ